MSVRTGVDEYNQPISDINSGYVGEFKYFGFSDVPPHCLACDGSAVSRATYSELFEVFGETYGAGDGETTFNLPDFRGHFLRGAGGAAAAIGVEQSDAMREINANFLIRKSVDGSSIITAANGAFSMQPGGGQSSGIAETQATQVETTRILFTTRVVPTAAENRPINYAANICVVYE